MREIPLDSDDVHCAILQSEVLVAFERAGKENARQILRRTANVLELGDPASRIETLAGCTHLQKLTAGNEYRLYCIFEDSMPGYKILHGLGITAHKYRNSRLKSLDPKAGQLRSRMKNLETTTAARDYLEQFETFSPDELRDISDSW